MAGVKKLFCSTLALMTLSGSIFATTGCSKEGGGGAATGGSTDTSHRDKSSDADTGAGYGTRGDSETGGITGGTMREDRSSGSTGHSSGPKQGEVILRGASVTAGNSNSQTK